MKRTILFLCVLMAVICGRAQSGARFLQSQSGTNVGKVSSDGKYAVGRSLQSQSWAIGSVQGFESFVWDLEEDKLEWLTSFDATDYSKSGYFTDVNDRKVVCGYFKNEDYTIMVSSRDGVSYVIPLNTAAVWKDGKLTCLGFGDYDTSVFNDPEQGSFAMAISNDSKTVVGYVSSGWYYDTYPCAWVMNDATGEYDFVRYALPENGTYGKIYDVSGDGSIAVGTVSVEDPEIGWPENHACYWTSPDECIIIDDPLALASRGSAYAVSENGNYIAFTVDGREPLIYLIQEKDLVRCGSYEGVMGLEIGGVSDNGDVFGVYKYGTVLTGTYNRPFWYSHINKAMTDFDYFIDLWAPGVDIPYEFTNEAKESLNIVGASAGGNVIVGNGFNSGFAIVTDAKPLEFPNTVNGLDARVTDLGEITLSAYLPEASTDMKPEKVIFYRDGDVVGEVLVSDVTSVTYVDKDVPVGEHAYAASVSYVTENGERLASSRSTPVTVWMEDSFDIPLYDSFENDLSANYWTVVKDYGQTAYQNIGCTIYSGFNNSCCLFSAMYQSEPYSYSVVSRNIDAREKDDVYVSFAWRWEYLEGTDYALDKDTISLELCTDGKTWLAVKDMPLCDVDSYCWTFEYIDLAPWVAGKLFKVRLRLHGLAAAQYVFKADEFAVAERPARGGLTDVIGGFDGDGKFRLSWKNSLDAYPLTYLPNPYFNAGLRALGDDGKPLVAANMFTKEDLAMFKGMYITSVTTMINHDTSMEGGSDTRASIVVFEDGNIVREQEFAPDYNNYQTVKLDEPLLIDGTKDVKIGVKVFDYDARQIPLTYYKSYEYVQGKSDLYSQDGGITWKKLSDYWVGSDDETDGYASWLIIGNVTDSATPEVPAQIDFSRFAAEVYKNGEKVTKRFVYLLEGGYADGNSLQGDSYQVRLFYTDGTCTELSNVVTNNGIGTSISDVDMVVDGYTIDDGKLIVDGNVEHVALYNAAGMMLYEGMAHSLDLRGYGSGVYVLKVYRSGGSPSTYKFVF